MLLLVPDCSHKLTTAGTVNTRQMSSASETNIQIPPNTRAHTLRNFRIVLGFFMVALVLSGLTAFPLQHELEWVSAARGPSGTAPSAAVGSFDQWILTVRDGLQESYAAHPWLAYGTDWLAFAHIVVAVFFVGALKDPARNIWVLQAGMIACALVIPLALICGPIRHIPFGWRLLDCSFGVFGIIPLYYCYRLARRLPDKRRCLNESN